MIFFCGKEKLTIFAALKSKRNLWPLTNRTDRVILRLNR